MSKKFVIIVAGIIVAGIIGCASGCSDTYELLTTRLPDAGAADVGPSPDGGDVDGGDGGDTGGGLEPLPIIDGISHIGAGRQHTCLLADGRIICTGSGVFGAIGTDESVLTEFTRIDDSGDWVDLDTHRFTSCAKNRTRQLWCWGHNDFGQGDGSAQEVLSVPTLVNLPGPVSDFSAGDRVSCAIVGEELYCWGGEEGGAFLTADSQAIRQPSLIPIPEPPDEVESGRGNVCVRAQTRVYCWGDNLLQILSIETGGEPLLEPTRVYPSGDWAGIELSVGHLCLRSTTGEVTCTGSNASRQIADETDLFFENPTPTGLVGSQHTNGTDGTCALDAGVLRCRGRNDAGQFNVMTAGPDDLRGVTVVGEGGYEHLSAGTEHVCASRSNRVIHCWGAGNDGRLGADLDGPTWQTVESTIPAP